MTRIKYNIFSLKHQLELKTDKPYPWTEVSRLSGVNINSLKNIAGNKTRRVDFDNLESLIDFFAAQGMPITISDLLTVTTTE